MLTCTPSVYSRRSLCNQQPGEDYLAMLAKLYSCAVLGLDGGLIEVEVDISQGLPAFTMRELPDYPMHQHIRTSVHLIRRVGGHLLIRH